MIEETDINRKDINRKDIKLLYSNTMEREKVDDKAGIKSVRIFLWAGVGAVGIYNLVGAVFLMALLWIGIVEIHNLSAWLLFYFSLFVLATLVGIRGVYILGRYNMWSFASAWMTIVLLMGLGYAIVGATFKIPILFAYVPAAYITNIVSKFLYLSDSDTRITLPQLVKWWRAP
ncbi:MAG: hypothetical protein QW680_11155 [Pyrobaculum sp.]